MKKLLIISTNSIHLYNFYKLVKDGFESVAIVTNEQNPNLNYNNSQIYYLNFSVKSPIRFYKSLKMLKRILNDYKPDIIHSQQITTNSYLAVKAGLSAKIPVVVTAWGSDVLLTPSKGYFYKKMVRYILLYGSAFSADSEYVAKKMDELANRKLNTSIANFAAIEPAENPKKENIIYSNRLLNKLYRIDSIIKAFAVFVKNMDYNDWRLFIAGEGSETEALKDLSISLNIADKVKFCGWLSSEENWDNYKRARIFVSVPESDGTSISLLEAMAAGCMPVVSDLPANNEWIKNYENGIIVSDLNTNFFEEAIKIDESKAMSVNRNLILTKASFKANQESFFNIYKKLYQNK